MTCRRKQAPQRLQPPAGPPDPVAQGGAVELDPLPGEDPGLAVQGQEIGVLGHQHVREQRLGRHPAGDRPLRRGRLHHRLLAGPAAVAGAADHLHPQLRRGRCRASRSCPRRSTCKAPPQQGQLLSSTSTRTSTRGRCAGRAPRLRRRDPGRPRGAAPCSRLLLRRLGGGHGLLEVLQAELQLVGVELLRAPAELPALQLPDQAAAASRSRPGAALDARTRTVSRSISQSMRSGAFCWATTSVICCSCGSSRSGSRGRSSSASDMALFYWPKARNASTSAHQAVLGRRTGRGCSRCHGKPSSRVASCAPLSRTTPSAGEGQQNRPASSLFAVQDQAGPVVDQDLHPVGPPGAEDEDLARERVGPQRLLHQGGQAVHALAEVDRLRPRAGCAPPAGPRSRQAPHHLEHPAQRRGVHVRADPHHRRAERDLDPARRLGRCRRRPPRPPPARTRRSRRAPPAPRSCWRQTKSWLGVQPVAPRHRRGGRRRVEALGHDPAPSPRRSSAAAGRRR